MGKAFFILFLIGVLGEQLFYFYIHNKNNDKRKYVFVFTSIISMIAIFLYSAFC